MTKNSNNKLRRHSQIQCGDGDWQNFVVVVFVSQNQKTNVQQTTNETNAFDWELLLSEGTQSQQT